MREDGIKVAVVGAGITGLSAAYHLGKVARDAGVDVSVRVFEQADRTGGAIETSRRGNRFLEHGPDSILSTKPAAVELIEELGMKGEMIPTNESNRRSLIAWQGKLETLPEGFVMLAPSKILPFLASSLFSWNGKIRMALDLVSPARPSSEDESVESFALRRFGPEALEKVIQPMVGGIYTGDVSKLSAHATLPQFVEMEQKYGSVIRGLIRRSTTQESTASGARYSMFISLKNGLQSLTNKLEERIGVENIQKGSRVYKILKANDQWIVETESTSQEFDAVIFATPAYVTSQLMNSVNKELAAKLSVIESASAAIVNMVYRRADIKHSLNGFGFVVPAAEQRSILAASFISNKFAGRAEAGTVAIRVFLGGVLQPRLLDNNDQQLMEIAHKELVHYLGASSDPIESEVSRYPRSMPQYNVGHIERVKELMTLTEEKLPGVFLAGSAYHGVGIPDCIASALRAARGAIEYAKGRSNVESVSS